MLTQSSWAPATTATTSTNTRSTTLKSFTTRVRLVSPSPQNLSSHLPSQLPAKRTPTQTPKKKISSTPKTSPTSPSTNAKNSRPSASKSLTSKQSTRPISLPSFGGSPNHSHFRYIPRQSRKTRHSRTVYCMLAIIFCWNRFWLLAAANFERHHPLTYFVLYICLVLLAWLA